ncbi:MAG TPA: hypothetical protein VFI39_11720 [Gemmatimonadales bacterium]|nr:hypothetical protein [Gemmatimonadales bacterium]
MTPGAGNTFRPIAAGRLSSGGPSLLLAAALLMIAGPVAAQSFHLGPVSGDFMAQAVGIVSSAAPMPHDVRVTEARLVQPVIAIGLGALGDHLQFRGTLDFEGWTIPDGELTPGAYGEGFIDRRHPHTYVHELMLTAHDVLGGPVHLSAAFGKGFVAFGSDDPMESPVERYPVDHHLAQILEREVAIAGIGVGPAAFEVTWFDGDEPEYPSEWPNGRRFGDSYALRATIRPATGLEAQGSYARVVSPEQRLGAGPTQSKWSASARLTRDVAGRPVYAMAEYARTVDAGGAFIYESWLAEGAITLGLVRPYLRLERTDRPEEPRVNGPYRTQLPPLDNSLLGITRWSIATVGAQVTALTALHRLQVIPFGELSVAGVHPRSGSFDPDAWYGGSTIVQLTAGVRLDWGMQGHRMGRYGTGPDDGAAMPGMAMGNAGAR